MILSGKIMISTVSAHKSHEIRGIFEPLGAVVVDYPMTEIQEAVLTESDTATLKKIDMFQWIIFTSGNGVKHFFNLLRIISGTNDLPPEVKIAAIGPRTSSELERIGRNADFTGHGNTAAELAAELSGICSIPDSNILLPLGNLAPSTLALNLPATSKCVRINVYNTLKSGKTDDSPAELIKQGRYDLLLLTSPSGVTHLSERLGNEFKADSIKAASIGSVTSEAAGRYGIRCLVTATRSTYAGLADEIVKYYSTNN